MTFDGTPVSKTFSTSAVLVFALFTIVPAWALGINALWFHFVALLAFTTTQKAHRSIAVANTFPLVLTLYILWYALSILVNSPHNELVRTTAAFYNWSFWLMGLLTHVAASSIDWRIWSNKLEQPFNIVAVSLAVASIWTVFAWYGMGIETGSISTLLGTLFDVSKLPPLLAQNFTMDIFAPDYINGEVTPRLSALAPYPTATAALAIFLAPFVMFRKPSGFVTRIIWLLAILGIIASLYLAFSRTIIASAIIAAIATILVYKRAFLIVALLSVLPVTLLLASSAEIAETVLNSRGGSTQSRLDLYFYQTSLALNEAPFFGLGIKDRLSQFVIPLGSHSTILGALYKTGIVGVLLVFALIISANALWVRALHQAIDKETAFFISKLGFCVLTISLWMLTEDIDAPPLVCFMFFLFTGVLASIAREPSKPGFNAQPQPQ